MGIYFLNNLDLFNHNLRGFTPLRECPTIEEDLTGRTMLTLARVRIITLRDLVRAYEENRLADAEGVGDKSWLKIQALINVLEKKGCYSSRIVSLWLFHTT